MISALTVHYYLEMPGKIVESNADTIADTRAEWHLSGLDAFSTTIYARSEVPLRPLDTRVRLHIRNHRHTGSRCGDHAPQRV
jgi:hypothetical protein